MVTSFPRILIGGVGGNCISFVLFVLNGHCQTRNTSGGVLLPFQQQPNVYLISYWHLCGVVLL